MLPNTLDDERIGAATLHTFTILRPPRRPPSPTRLFSRPRKQRRARFLRRLGDRPSQRPIRASLSPRLQTVPCLAGPFPLRYCMLLAAKNMASQPFPPPPPNPGHRLFRFFFPSVSTTYASGPLLALNRSRILVRGPNKQIPEGKFFYSRHTLPPGVAGQLRRTTMSHNSEDLTIKQDKAIAALLTSQTVVEAVKLPRCAVVLAQPGGFFCRLRRQIAGLRAGAWGGVTPRPTNGT